MKKDSTETTVPKTDAPKLGKNMRDSRIKVLVKKRTVGFTDPLSYKILNDQEIVLDKPKAYEFLELKTFNGERAVREMHVQFLYDEWISGRFLWHHVMLAEAVLFGVRYRINGQHTCWMRVNVPDDKEPITSNGVRMLTYKVDSEDQLRSLYSTFDRNAPRTVGHVSTVMLVGTEAADGIAPSYIRHLCAGFRLWWAGESWKNRIGGGVNPSDMIGVIKNNYSVLFNTVGRFFTIHYEDSVTIRRSAVIGAMFATFNKAVKASIEFWDPVSSGIGLTDKKDPRFQLREYINSVSHSIVRKGKRVTQDELFRACINSWNNWREGKLVTRVPTPKGTGDRRPVSS
jgi:hypothetical protein